MYGATRQWEKTTHTYKSCRISSTALARYRSFPLPTIELDAQRESPMLHTNLPKMQSELFASLMVRMQRVRSKTSKSMMSLTIFRSTYPPNRHPIWSFCRPQKPIRFGRCSSVLGRSNHTCTWCSITFSLPNPPLRRQWSSS